MKVLGCDFFKSNKGYNVAMCMLTDECENKIKYMEVFNNDCKLEDIADLIISKFESLNCDYVITDYLGLGIVLHNALKDKLRYKVRGYKYSSKENTKMIYGLYESKILEDLGLELKYQYGSDGRLKLLKEMYTDFEYLMVKTIGMANKLSNEIKEEINNNDIIQNIELSIEDISNSYKKMVNEYCDKIKCGDTDITNKLSMKRVLEDNLNYYEKVKRFGLCEECKLKLENVNNENDFLYNLIVDIEEIKNMLDELK